MAAINELYTVLGYIKENSNRYDSLCSILRAFNPFTSMFLCSSGIRNSLFNNVNDTIRKYSSRTVTGVDFLGRFSFLGIVKFAFGSEGVNNNNKNKNKNNKNNNSLLDL